MVTGRNDTSANPLWRTPASTAEYQLPHIPTREALAVDSSGLAKEGSATPVVGVPATPSCDRARWSTVNREIRSRHVGGHLFVGARLRYSLSASLLTGITSYL